MHVEIRSRPKQQVKDTLNSDITSKRPIRKATQHLYLLRLRNSAHESARSRGENPLAAELNRKSLHQSKANRN